MARTPDGRRRFSDADLDWLVLLSRLRATGMPVRDMLRYAELVRAGAGEQERLALLERHRDRVGHAVAAQQECLQLLDTKVGPTALAGHGNSAISGIGLDSACATFHWAGCRFPRRAWAVWG